MARRRQFARAHRARRRVGVVARAAASGRDLIALKVVPLCIPLAGLLRNRMYTYRWVSLIVWLYFVEGVVRAGKRTPRR